MSRMGRSWDPWRELERLQDEMNRLFQQGRRSVRRTEYPPVNIWQGEEGLAVTAEIPGLDVKDLDITVVGDTITLKGTFPAPSEVEGTTLHRRERTRGSFTRTLELPFAVDPQKTDASYDRGVLLIRLSRPEEHKPRKVEIRAG